MLLPAGGATAVWSLLIKCCVPRSLFGSAVVRALQEGHLKAGIFFEFWATLDGLADPPAYPSWKLLLAFARCVLPDLSVHHQAWSRSRSAQPSCLAMYSRKELSQLPIEAA